MSVAMILPSQKMANPGAQNYPNGLYAAFYMQSTTHHTTNVPSSSQYDSICGSIQFVHIK